VEPKNLSSYLERQSINPESIFAQLKAVDTNEPIRRRHDSNDNRDLHKWKYSKWRKRWKIRFAASALVS